MTAKTLLAAGFAALALAAPAAADTGAPAGQALFPETIPGAGLGGVAGAQATITRQAIGRGMIGAASFTVRIGKVTYVDPLRGVSFTSRTIRTVLFGQNAVKLIGVGRVNGQTVSFTAVGVHNALPGVDVFRIGWNHGATHGGRVTSGLMFIR
jgi:hypothetical protein